MLSSKKLMCSQAVKLTEQKGHFPEQQEQFGAFPGSWKAGHTEHRLCRALSRAKQHLGHGIALKVSARFLSCALQLLVWTHFLPGDA